MGKHVANTILYRGGEGAICTGLAVSSYGVNIGKKADLSEEFCPRLQFALDFLSNYQTFTIAYFESPAT